MLSVTYTFFKKFAVPHLLAKMYVILKECQMSAKNLVQLCMFIFFKSHISELRFLKFSRKVQVSKRFLEESQKIVLKMQESKLTESYLLITLK